MNFEYLDPEPNFDHKRVSGLVCNLFKLKDPKYATALEIAAGGKVCVVLNGTFKLVLKLDFLAFNI